MILPLRPRLVIALMLSAGIHAGLILSSNPPEAGALNLPSVALQIRLVPAAPVPADRAQTTEEPPVATPVSEQTADATGVKVGPARPQPDMTESAKQEQGSPVAFQALLNPSDENEASTSVQADAAYLSEEEVDLQPLAMNPIIPQYPSEPGLAGVGGMVKLQLLIDERGHVTSVDVQESALPAAFGFSATRAFETVRFQPGLRNGMPVRCRVITSIQFAPTALAQMFTARPDAQVGLRE